MSKLKPSRRGRTHAKVEGWSVLCRALALIILAASALCFQTRTARLDAPEVYAISNAQIVASAGRSIARGNVVIRNGLITEVGEGAKIPADAKVIDGSGLTVYPGIIDAYTHLGLPAPPQPAGPQGAGRQAAAAAAAANPQLAEQRLGDPSTSAADQVKPGGADDARAAGITAALTSPRQGILAGQSALINLAGTDSAKLVVRSPVALTVQFSTGGAFGGTYPASLMGTVAYIRQSFYDAIHYRDEHNRYERTKRGITRPEYDKRLAALQPVLRGDLPVLFVANSDLDIRRALMIADEFKLKLIIEGAMDGYRVAELLKSKNVPVILSLDFPRRPADQSDDQDESLRSLRERAEAPRGAARLAKAGVKFAFTSGTLRPQDFMANVQKAIENGLSKEDALRALTQNAAEILGVGEQLGTIEVGKIANLVVTSGDLTAKDTKIRYVFIDGNEIELKKPEPPPARPAGRAGTPPASVAGDWELDITTPEGQQVKVHMTLKLEEDMITGSMGTPMGTFPIKSGTVTGNQLRLTTTLEMGSDHIDAVIVGTIEGNSMRGTITAGSLGTSEFTGSRPR